MHRRRRLTLQPVSAALSTCQSRTRPPAPSPHETAEQPRSVPARFRPDGTPISRVISAGKRIVVDARTIHSYDSRLSSIMDSWTHDSPDVTTLLVCLFAAAIYLVACISPPALMDDVDAVQAQIARNMLDSGDWVTARLERRSISGKIAVGVLADGNLVRDLRCARLGRAPAHRPERSRSWPG